MFATAAAAVLAGPVLAGECAARFEIIAWPGGERAAGATELTLEDFEGGEVLLTEADVISASPRLDSARQPAVGFRFSSQGAVQFANHTAGHVGQPIAMVFDGRLLTAPVIREPIMGGRGMISGFDSAEEAAELAELLVAETCAPVAGS